MANNTGTVVIAPVVPNTSGDTYPTHEAIYGLGGLRTVATVADMNAIPTARRESGMKVWVTATASIYRLQDDLTTFVTELTSDQIYQLVNTISTIQLYGTKALANAALGTIPANAFIEVIVDETQNSRKTIYQKQSGVLVFQSFADNIGSVNYGSVTATSGQTVFTVPFTYTINTNTLMVFRNCAYQTHSLYTETNGTTVTFNSGVGASDVITFISWQVTPIGTILSTNVSTNATDFLPATTVQNALHLLIAGFESSTSPSGASLLGYQNPQGYFSNTHNVEAALNSVGASLATLSGNGFSGIPIQDEGTSIGNATTLNFVGGGVTASNSGGLTTITVPTPSVDVIDQTTDRGQANTLKFTGAAVSSTVTNGVATIAFTPTSGSGITGIVIKDDGISEGNAQTINFASGLAASSVVSGSSDIAWTGATVKDEGVVQGSALGVTSLNFVGAGVTATVTSGEATVTIPTPSSSISVKDHNTAGPRGSGTTYAGISTLIGEGAATVTSAANTATLSVPEMRPLYSARVQSNGTVLSSGMHYGVINGSSHPTTGQYNFTIQNPYSDAPNPKGIVSITTERPASPTGLNPADIGQYQIASLTGDTIQIIIYTNNNNGDSIDTGFSFVIY